MVHNPLQIVNNSNERNDSISDDILTCTIDTIPIESSITNTMECAILVITCSVIMTVISL